MKGQRYAIRRREGVKEPVWLEFVKNGWWRGIRIKDGLRTRGPVNGLLGRYATEEEMLAALEPTQ